MQDKRILITGGAGLVGSHMADIAVREGAAEVVVYENLVRGRRENLARAKLGGLAPLTSADQKRVVAALHEALRRTA